MLNFFKKRWKFSSLRFYWLNAKWNYRFWLFAEKMYTQKVHSVNSNEYKENTDWKIFPKKKVIKSVRFLGYRFEGRLYDDNPGLQGILPEVWAHWKKKGLLNK